ncbi:MAG: hypothetical protein K4571_03185 [Deltaproteobacteria bacterium]
MRKYFLKLWNSPTFTTWGAFLSRPLSLLLLTPLILHKFSASEIALWYLFGIFMGFQSLANLGFNSVFIRSVGFAMGGAKSIGIFKDNTLVETDHEPNWDLIKIIIQNTKLIYMLLALFFVVVLSVFGTWSLIKPISQVARQQEIWLSWITVVLVSGLSIYSDTFKIYLRGTDNVALVMRWETLFNMLAILSASVVLFMTGSFLYTILSNQIWRVINFIRNYYLSRFVNEKRYREFKGYRYDKEIFLAILPSSWRTWLSHLMSYGLMQLTGVYYAQIGESASVATYLFSLRIINVIDDFSNAPFYSHQPRYARLFAQNNFKELKKIVTNKMFLTYMTFAVSCALAGIFGDIVLPLIKSNITFANPLLWGLMCMGYFLKRYTSLHLQFYQITNHIVAHTVNIVQGLIILLFVALFVSTYGVYSFPLSLIIANLLFGVWYASHKSHKRYEYNLWEFELKTSIVPFIIVLSVSLLTYFIA